MSEELRPLSECTVSEIIQELRRRVSVGVFVLLVGDPSAAETLRDQGPIPTGTPTTDGLWTHSDDTPRDEMEELHRCLKVAVGGRLASFKDYYGALPRCYGESA